MWQQCSLPISQVKDIVNIFQVFAIFNIPVCGSGVGLTPVVVLGGSVGPVTGGPFVGFNVSEKKR